MPKSDVELRETIRSLLRIVSRDTHEAAVLTFPNYVNLKELEEVASSCYSRMGTICRLVTQLKAKTWKKHTITPQP